MVLLLQLGFITMNNIIMILLDTFSMSLFTIYPRIYVCSEVSEEKHQIQEFTKRSIMVSFTFIVTLFLATLLQFV